jgi:hypothetical protein
MGTDGAFITSSDFRMDGDVTAAYWFCELAPQTVRLNKNIQSPNEPFRNTGEFFGNPVAAGEGLLRFA